MRRSWDEELAGSFVGLTILLAIVAVAVIVWLVVKAAALVVRVGVAHPDNLALRIAGGVCIGTILLAGLFGERVPMLVGLAVMSIIALVVTAKAVELYYDERLQPEVTREYVLDQVLHQPWWASEAA